MKNWVINFDDLWGYLIEKATSSGPSFWKYRHLYRLILLGLVFGAGRCVVSGGPWVVRFLTPFHQRELAVDWHNHCPAIRPRLKHTRFFPTWIMPLFWGVYLYGD